MKNWRKDGMRSRGIRS